MPKTPSKSSFVQKPVSNSFERLCALMTDLRKRCDWDSVQTLHTLRAYLLEETHEVLDVLEDLSPLGEGERAQEHKSELGDLLLQIVFQSEIQSESGRFDINDVCDAIYNKLLRRHPHLYGSEEEKARGKQSWEELKRQERKDEGEQNPSALDGVPKALPALLRAYRMGEKAHRVGFDWPDPSGVIAKIKEEVVEIEEAVESGVSEAIEGEIGDALYALVNLSRHFGLDPESALRKTMSKFERRFRYVENAVSLEGKSPESCSLDELEAHWADAKRQEG